MQDKSITHSLCMAGAIIFLSALSFYINFTYYHYQGNSFFPHQTLEAGLFILLLNLGMHIACTKESYPILVVRELLYFFAMMSLIALASNAVQLTPFPPIDKQIINFESLFHINMQDILIWTNSHPGFKHLLKFIYDSLGYQMSILPLFLIILGRFEHMKQYYFLMLFTCLLGFVFYYFFPTTAPASMIASPLFQADQIATGLKFKQIHNHMQITTSEGGLIAMPSFHTIWAILCVYLVKDYLLIFIIMTLINTLLILSCVLLGWHYPSDVLAGILITFIAIYYLPKIP